jgi:hypothetical protein
MGGAALAWALQLQVSVGYLALAMNPARLAGRPTVQVLGSCLEVCMWRALWGI